MIFRIRPRKAVCAVFLCYAAAGFLLYTSSMGAGEMEVNFLDIGQGDAIYIRTPSGKDMLIDGGPSRVVLQKLSEAMPFYDRTIDVVIATHPDSDHIGGLPDVLKRYKVGIFIESGVESANAIDDEIRRIRAEKEIPSRIAKRGMTIDFRDGARFDILFPDRDVGDLKDTNEGSIVGKMAFGSTSVMLTGDSPQKIENYLVTLDGKGLKSEVLKAGHHGSRTSSSERFVKAVSPAYAVISAGEKNRYGHPHKEVLSLFESLGIKIKKTWEARLLFVTDGKSFEIR